ncbi:hypothetical protein AVEN_74983-1 [Araneus ventricosus]|uniref:RNA-directed DNA polymerase n=1 Tax=Araneus ventricosus TaxID=182803 RepID=A0A4Y2FY26_ARAVE|nr:hypothetical protein AVEN_74983-1 [Araneus ventricosus]
MDFTDLKSAMAYSMKFESAKTASKTSIHARSIETDDDTWKERDDKFESLLKALEKFVNNLAAEQNAPRRNPNVTCWKCFKKGHVQRACQVNFVYSRKLTCGRLAERKIPTLNKSPEKGLKVSALSGGGNGLYLKGSICDIPYLEKNEIRTGSEKFFLFSGSIQHRKRTSDGKNVLSRRLCFEGCEPCSNAEKKFRKETDISVEALTMTTENRWSLSEIQKAQLEDPDIRPILKMKINSEDRPSWQEIARETPATKRYWALWNSLYLKDGVLYRKWESNGGFYRRQLILPNCRIQEVLQETHGNISRRHFGVMKTLRKTRERFYWDRLRADIEKWCRECQACGARKQNKEGQYLEGLQQRRFLIER